MKQLLTDWADVILLLCRHGRHTERRTCFDFTLVLQQHQASPGCLSSMQILVVGGGPAGLASARHLLPYLEQRAELSLTVVEKSDQIGGIWNGKPQSPVYRDLHTNLPKELMAFPDLDFEEETKSYVHHSSVSKYLRQYAEKFSLEKVL